MKYLLITFLQDNVVANDITDRKLGLWLREKLKRYPEHKVVVTFCCELDIGPDVFESLRELI